MFLELPRRKPNRLEGYDYSQNGAYFITLCIKDRRPVLWHVGARIARPLSDGHLSAHGLVVKAAIENITAHYQTISVDKYVIMPNHVHLILTINDDGRAMRAPTISTVINQMKGYVTKQIRVSFWQKLFHDHIIRNELEYQKIWAYIDTNPLNWKDDCYYVN